MQQNINKLAAGLHEKMIHYRRDFHKYPESGWTEFRTSAKIAQLLGELGYTIKLGENIIARESMMGIPDQKELKNHMDRAVAEGADPALVEQMKGGLTGVVAELKCGAGPAFALRFDIDANDISEACDKSHRPFLENFHSVHTGVMHACGHDGHAALGLGVAEILVELKDSIAGTVKLIFQPAEEGVRGAGPMVDAGVLDGVDYILGGHIGFLAKKRGQLMCGADKFLATTKFDVQFTGVPAHAGGAPEQGRNALLAAASAALNLHAIPRHSQGASRVTVGRFEAGQGRNIIPPDALLKVETRGETSEIDEFMFDSARQVIEGAAVMYGVAYEISLMGKTKSGSSSPKMVERLAAVAREIEHFDQDDIHGIMAMGGSEDFSQMLTVVQQQGGEGTYFSLGTELSSGHHDFYFDFDENCFAPGAELIVSMVLDVLS